MLNMISILLEELVGVIETDNPVTSIIVADVVENVSVLVALTTCNTDPAGIDAFAIPLEEVVSVPASVVF